MAALVVILMAMYHISRTIWGLTQLDTYHLWSIDLTKRMLTFKKVEQRKWEWMVKTAEVGFWRKKWQQAIKIFMKNGGSSEMEMGSLNIDISEESVENGFGGITKEIERMLRVNNTVVDNEFGGTDLSVSLDFKKVGFRRPSEF